MPSELLLMAVTEHNFGSRNGVLELLTNPDETKRGRADYQNSMSLCLATSFAEFPNNTTIVRLLLEHGADAKADNSQALVNALMAQNVPTVYHLLEYGADPDVEGSLGMQIALRTQNYELFDILATFGAKITSAETRAIATAFPMPFVRRLVGICQEQLSDEDARDALLETSVDEAASASGEVAPTCIEDLVPFDMEM